MLNFICETFQPMRVFVLQNYLSKQYMNSLHDQKQNLFLKFLHMQDISPKLNKTNLLLALSFIGRPQEHYCSKWYWDVRSVWTR